MWKYTAPEPIVEEPVEEPEPPEPVKVKEEIVIPEPVEPTCEQASMSSWWKDDRNIACNPIKTDNFNFNWG